ncbi:MAG: TetR/AcrR family transcriptional regulator [Chitinophagaceae bacterium]|nr:TetR/AcrR family transcriptional regulator [Chitinophagaceae bacterium]
MSKGEQTRQMIIERSAPIFNKKGIAATAMSDIMDATKLAKGSLYVHFDNKDVLAEAAVDFNLELLSKKLMSAISQFDNPKEKLFAYIDAYRNPIDPPVIGGCPMLNFGMEADDQIETVREQVAAMVNKSQQLIIDIIAKGIRQGIFKPDWNYKEFATLMFATIEGGILISRTTRKTDKMAIINRNLKKMIEAQLL